jgi:tRNA nucleotidyltransferase/poly(A) polymerase
MEGKFTDLILDLHQKKWIRSLMFNPDTNLYLVGGIVRDTFLGRESKDVDLVVEGMELSEILKILQQFGRVDIVGESFKVIKFKPKGFAGEPFDIATPRKDIKVGSGHKGFRTVPVKTIHEDLKRRDFTINSMAVDVLNGKLIDPFKGKRDLKKGIIKATDKSAFIEDPLRILRAIQFAARFEFFIESRTEHLMKKNSELIRDISGERILEEFEKILSKSGNTTLAFEMIEKFDVDLALFNRKIGFHEEIPQLDRLSFFFTLAKLGGANPKRFFMERLHGDGETGKALETLEQIFSFDLENMEESELRFLLFKALKKSNKINSCIILPQRVDEIIFKMRQGILPMSPKDIKLNGGDVIKKIGQEGPEVGIVLEKVQREALMKRFDFKDRDNCLNFLERL